MKLESENKKAFIGSIGFHLLLAILFFFWRMDARIELPEYIEVAWGTSAEIPTLGKALPAIRGSEGVAKASLLQSTRQVDLPERKIDLPEEALRIPEAKKLDLDQANRPEKTKVHEDSKSQKDRSVGIGMGEKELFATPGPGDKSSEVTNPRTGGSLAGEAGEDVSVSMYWRDGGTRKKISGELPTYPSGVKVEAQIKIEVVVMPDGSVTRPNPIQKGNTKLEEAAIRSVRLWKFEPLKTSVPQQDQNCIITFNFRLQ